MSWTSLRDTLLQFFDQWQRLAFVAFILVGTLVATLAVHFLVRRFHGRPRTGESVWRDAILGALTAPLQAIVWLIGLSVAENVLTTRGAMPLLSEMFPPVRDVAAIVITVWFVIRLTRRAAANLRSHALTRGNEFDETAADAIGKFVIATIVIVAALAMMQTLGFSIASLLTFGGVTGIVLGFAAQGLVSNLLGGITIYASRPFKVGDHIILPDVAPTSGYAGWQAGEVQHIGWRATRILDWNGKPFYVPNAKFNTETIVNHSRMAYREISEFVCVRLQDIDKISGIVADVNHMLEEHPEMGDYLVFRFDSFGDYALKLYLYAYTAKTITACLYGENDYRLHRLHSGQAGCVAQDCRNRGAEWRQAGRSGRQCVSAGRTTRGQRSRGRQAAMSIWPVGLGSPPRVCRWLCSAPTCRFDGRPVT